MSHKYLRMIICSSYNQGARASLQQVKEYVHIKVMAYHLGGLFAYVYNFILLFLIQYYSNSVIFYNAIRLQYG